MILTSMKQTLARCFGRHKSLIISKLSINLPTGYEERNTPHTH